MATRTVRVYDGARRARSAVRAGWATLEQRLTVSQARTVAILTGGALGTLGRAGMAEALPHRVDAWPWATFIVNLAGAFILGWLLTRLSERVAPGGYWRLFLGTGFCGALTTFSTFQVETFRLIDAGHAPLAGAYAGVSILAGMAVAVAGILTARWGRHW
jgi:fluoride exporter